MNEQTNEFNGERSSLLLNYLRELRTLKECGINCAREINEVMSEINGELDVGRGEDDE
ncbi:hypothetical protein JOC34_002833 [Virgibacillus halotolerans]|uniref:hypothetical protein n=1 Tax=Virgibacillus halotolerans TaxID=1071053 RepID=UPI001961264E|nr:hypothetical protein [Virgibacillus halotolerans]MBM7600442.1 hypothetical protein [Virgibacillus halotolerans]